jgi:hypothetical protein
MGYSAICWQHLWVLVNTCCPMPAPPPCVHTSVSSCCSSSSSSCCCCCHQPPLLSLHPLSTVARQVEESKDKGAVRQALGASLQQELTDLYRLMAVLEAQQAYSLPMPGRAAAARLLVVRPAWSHCFSACFQLAGDADAFLVCCIGMWGAWAASSQLTRATDPAPLAAPLAGCFLQRPGHTDPPPSLAPVRIATIHRI